MTTRTVGVEEELMLVDPATGRLSQCSNRVIAAAHGDADTVSGDETTGERIQQELFLSQLETNSRACSSLDELDASIRRGRRDAVEAARAAGCSAVAMATPVLSWDRDEQRATPKPRYQHIVDEYADVSAFVCGMHVHVQVSADEAVPVLDHLRPWLPTLLAMSVNSPFDAGRDTGYASTRSLIWGRWPTSGPAEPFGDLRGYREATQALMDSGAAMDRGMLYLDARLAERYPTIEIRVADVCTDVGDAVLIAGIARALITTVARQAAAGLPVPRWRSDLLRAARWRAARYGMARDLVHPITASLTRPRQVVADLLDFVESALDGDGDRERIEQLVEHLFSHGTGATRQHSVFESTGSLERVVQDLMQRTEAEAAARA